MSGITSIPGLSRIELNNMRVLPSVQVGYKKIGLNLDLNIPATQLLSPFVLFPEFGSLLDLYPLDIKVQSADLAVGSFRLDWWITPVCSLFGSVSANIPRSVGLESSKGPAVGVIPPQARRWTGSSFQWSEFEFGGSYNINQALGFVVGIRFDRISVRFSDPEPVPSYNFITIVPPAIRTATFPNYSGDLNTYFTIPYFGFEFLGPYFKGSLLIGSAGARLRLPLDLNHPGTYITGFVFGASGRRDISEQAEYSFNKAGIFLEAGLESSFPVRSFNCTLWAKGNLLKIQGDGDVNLGGRSSFFLLALNFPNVFSGSNTGTSTLNQYTFDVGVSGTFNF